MENWSADAFNGYLAGFLDGEGCIEINKDECGIRLRLANTHRPTLDAMCRRLGFGRVEEYGGRAERGYKRLFCYAISSAPDVERFLLTVRPFMSIKAEKADYALSIIRRQRERMDELDGRNKAVLDAIAAGRMQKDIAAEFGISQSLVSRIKCGHTWPKEIERFNARRGLKKGMRPSDQVFRLHGLPPAQ